MNFRLVDGQSARSRSFTRWAWVEWPERTTLPSSTFGADAAGAGAGVDGGRKTANPTAAAMAIAPPTIQGTRLGLGAGSNGF